VIDRVLYALAGHYRQVAKTAPRRLRRELAARGWLYNRMARCTPAQAKLLYAALTGLESRLPGFLDAQAADSGGTLGELSQAKARIEGRITHIDIIGDFTPSMWAAYRPLILGAQYLHVTINSRGGFAPVGLEVFHALQAKPDTVATVHRVCASAAVFALQGARVRRMESDAWLMVHSPRHYAGGPMPAFLEALEVLRRCQRLCVECLQRCQPPPDGGDWFDGRDRWLRPAEALRLGLVDEIVPPQPEAPRAGLLPPDDPDADAEDLLIDLLFRLYNQFGDKAAFRASVEAFFGACPEFAVREP
jgi:ATP-dependent protease ClpP protease subunit